MYSDMACQTCSIKGVLFDILFGQRSLDDCIRMLMMASSLLLSSCRQWLRYCCRDLSSNQITLLKPGMFADLASLQFLFGSNSNAWCIHVLNKAWSNWRHFVRVFASFFFLELLSIHCCRVRSSNWPNIRNDLVPFVKAVSGSKKICECLNLLSLILNLLKVDLLTRVILSI